MTKLKVAFRNFANAPKNCIGKSMEVTYNKIPESNLLFTAITMYQRKEKFRAGVVKPAVLLMQSSTGILALVSWYIFNYANS
jgi:hypothetical protein